MSLVTPSLEGDRLFREIMERGYAEFAHYISPDQVDELISAYADFTLAHPDPDLETMSAMLPDDNPELKDQLDDLDRSKDKQAKWHKYRTNVPGVGKPYGYTNRTHQEQALLLVRGTTIPPEDKKEYYHYSPRHFALMSKNHRDYGWGLIPREVVQLDRLAKPIHQQMSALMFDIAYLLEETHPGVREYFDKDSLQASPLRIVFYHPDDSMPYYGNNHRDKCDWTLQPVESHHGLRVRDPQTGLMVPVLRTTPQQTVVFPSLNFEESFDKKTPFKPMHHDVVALDTLNEGRSIPPQAAEVCARWAIIFFAVGRVFHDPGKAVTHATS